jgi:DNA-binding CsgD family transcriptional regulator
MRGSDSGPYDAEDVAALNKLAPHFLRAIKLQRQLLEIDLQKRTALDALNLLPIGIVIADADAQVLFVNRTAERLSQEEGGIGLHGGRIWADDRRQTSEIWAKLRRAVLSAEAGELVPGWSAALKRPPPRRPLSLTISPLWGNHLKTSLGFLVRPYGILFISDPDSVQETHVELFQRLYGLTASEAVVLKHLCDGLKPQDIADRLHVSIKTVRTHLSNLFAKTATSRQSELIRLALASQPQAAF